MKPKPNGHDPEPAAEVTNASTVRTRRHRARKRKGVVLLQAEIQPDMIGALVGFGWLHESEARNREAVTAAIGALVYAALNAGVRPAHSGKAFVPIDLQAVEAALPWLKPGEAVTSESAGRAVANVAKCSAAVGFGPVEFSERLRALAGIN